MDHKIWVYRINHMLWSEGAVSRGWLQFSRFGAGRVRRVMAGQVLHTKCSIFLEFHWKETRVCAGNASSDRTVASGSWVPDLTCPHCNTREWLPRDACQVRASLLPVVGHGKSHSHTFPQDSNQLALVDVLWRSPNFSQQRPLFWLRALPEWEWVAC